jgi:hypothetical protein
MMQHHVSNKLWIANETTQNYTEVTTNGTTLNAGEGYVVRMGETGGVTFIGSSYTTGNVLINGLTRTGSTAANRGYNLVGNPLSLYLGLAADGGHGQHLRHHLVPHPQ